MILAAKQNHADLMRYLVVEARADVNIQAEKVTCTANHAGHMQCVAVQYAEWTALFFSVKNGDQGLAEFLIKNGANPFRLDEVRVHDIPDLLLSKLKLLMV